MRHLLIGAASLCMAVGVSLASERGAGVPSHAVRDSVPAGHSAVAIGKGLPEAPADLTGLLWDEKDGGNHAQTVASLTRSNPLTYFCTFRTSSDSATSCSMQAQPGTDFCSVSSNHPGLGGSGFYRCSVAIDGGTGVGTCSAYNGDPAFGHLTCSVSLENGGPHPGFICTASYVPGSGGSGSGFCSVNSGADAVCSTWQTDGSGGTQVCSTSGAPGSTPQNTQCSAQSDAASGGWCSVSASEESNVVCTTMDTTTSRCSTIGGTGGNTNCSTRDAGGNIVGPSNDPAYGPNSSVCKVP